MRTVPSAGADVQHEEQDGIEIEEVDSTLESEMPRFAQIPEWIFDAASDNAYKVYGLLAMLALGQHKAWPAYAYMEERTGKSRSTLRNGVNELIRIGALVRTERYVNGRQRSNAYVLRFTKPRGATGCAPQPVAGGGRNTLRTKKKKNVEEEKVQDLAHASVSATETLPSSLPPSLDDEVAEGEILEEPAKKGKGKGAKTAAEPDPVVEELRRHWADQLVAIGEDPFKGANGGLVVRRMRAALTEAIAKHGAEKVAKAIAYCTPTFLTANGIQYAVNEMAKPGFRPRLRPVPMTEEVETVESPSRSFTAAEAIEELDRRLENDPRTVAYPQGKRIVAQWLDSGRLGADVAEEVLRFWDTRYVYTTARAAAGALAERFEASGVSSTIGRWLPAQLARMEQVGMLTRELAIEVQEILVGVPA